MKVPTNVTNRTTRGGGRLAPVQVAGVSAQAFGGGIATAMGQVGQALERQAEVVKQKQEQNNRFATLKNFTEFETSVAQTLTELKRNAPIDGSGYLQTATEAYKAAEQEFLSTRVPPELQDEFRYRAGLIESRIIGDSLEFEYTAADAYFRQGISDMLSQARTEIDQNPAATEAWAERLHEAINTQDDLPEVEKEALRRNVNIAMLSTEYKTRIREQAAENALIDPTGDAMSQSMAVIAQHEGFRTEAYADTRTSDGSYAGHRVGFGSDTIHRPDGTVERVRPGTKVTREEAEYDLQVRITQFQSGIRKAVGDERWATLPPAAKAALTSVAYNYGSLPKSVVNAVRTGDTVRIANAVENLSANPRRRKEEADLIRGAAGIPAINIMTDPRYSDIPYEDKVALRTDAEREASEAAAAAQKQQTAIHNERMNTLLNGLNDGTAGLADIDAARQAGWLRDYDDISKAQRVYAARNEEAILQANTLAKLDTPGAIWDPTDPNTQKGLNAVIGDAGVNAVTEMDRGYIDNIIYPLVDRTQVIPSSVVGALEGMVRSTNQSQSVFALDVLSGLRDRNAKAFAHQAPERLAKDVEFFAARRHIQPVDEIMRTINSQLNAQERQLEIERRTQAGRVLNAMDGSSTVLQRHVDKFLKRHNAYWITGTPTYGSTPASVQAVEQEYSTLFEDNFAKTGDVDTAAELTMNDMERNWGVTEVGGVRQLMRRPPEKAGYPPIMDSYDYIGNQVRQTLKLGEGDRFELFSDEQTEDEFREWQVNGGPPPSYRIVTENEFGYMEIARNEDGSILRMNFPPTEEDLQLQADHFDRQHEISIIEDRMREFEKARIEAGVTGQEIPPEMIEEHEADIRQLEELNKRHRESDPQQRKLREMWEDDPRVRGFRNLQQERDGTRGTPAGENVPGLM